MATAGHNLSIYDKNKLPSAADYSIGIVVAEWNDDITSRLLEGALQALKENGVKKKTSL